LTALIVVASAAPQYDDVYSTATYKPQQSSYDNNSNMPVYKPAPAPYQPATYRPSTYRPSTYRPSTYAPATYAPTSMPQYETEGPAEYKFSYDVNAPETYDVKSQSESLKDGYTVGQYSLIDADGMRRTVDYTADDINGFQATVKREPVNNNSPSYSAPQYSAPQYQRPTYKMPTYNAPKYEASVVYSTPTPSYYMMN
jgi:hypothetical protein